MDDSSDARLPRGLEENERVADRIGVLEQAVVESHPVRIVEYRQPFNCSVNTSGSSK